MGEPLEQGSSGRRPGVATFLGNGLKAAGASMGVLCGFCTLSFAVPNLFQLWAGGDIGYSLMFLEMSLVVGVAPSILGFGLYAVGVLLAQEPTPVRRDFGPAIEFTGLFLYIFGVLATIVSLFGLLTPALSRDGSYTQWVMPIAALIVSLGFFFGGRSLNRLGFAWSKDGGSEPSSGARQP